MNAILIISLAVTSLVMSSCATQSLPERLPAYFGVDKAVWSKSPTTSMPVADIKARLLAVNDTTAPQSAPALSEEEFAKFTHRLKVNLGKQLPVTVVNVIDAASLTQGKNAAQFVRLAQQEEVNYLILAVLSSTEKEVFDRFPLQGNQQGGGARGGLLAGVRAENYALVELALVNGTTGLPVVHASGSAWSVLERLNVPLESNVYPVVRRDVTQPPIYPTQETAYDTLRAVSANDAMKQALMHLQEEWRKQPSS